MEKKSIYSQQLKAGTNKTYFLDVKQNERGASYLVLTESRKQADDSYERRSITIFDEEIEKFGEAFVKALLHFKKKDRETIIEEARLNYPRAYEPWSKEDDLALEVMHGEGQPVNDIAKHLQRQPGAVTLRIRKLGLQDRQAA